MQTGPATAGNNRSSDDDSGGDSLLQVGGLVYEGVSQKYLTYVIFLFSLIPRGMFIPLADTFEKQKNTITGDPDKNQQHAY